MADLGKRLEDLRWLRERLMAAVDADPESTAALARPLMVCLEQIDVIEKAQPKGSKVDELSNRRKARRATAANRSPARKRGGDVGAGSS